MENENTMEDRRKFLIDTSQIYVLKIIYSLW